jgi:hypothetical protein
LKDDEAQLRSKKAKMTKTFGPIMSCYEGFYCKKTVNSENKSIMFNHKWELMIIPPERKLLDHM